MVPVTSMSAGRTKLPIVNDNCALRRNVAVQPYGRCSVCTLQLRQCHAWQSSAMSFVLVILILVPLVVTAPWAVAVSVAAALALLVAQGMTVHKRTDELIFGQHSLERTTMKLQAARDGLERDVAARTERLREANLELARANLELAELASRRAGMVLDVSHDLRTPLTSIKGAVQNVLDGIAGPVGDDQREYLTIVRDHAERMIVAVSELVDAARRQEVRIALDAEPVDVGALSREVAKSLQPIAQDRGVTLDVEAPEAQTLADREKLRKVIENLVGNALKFTEKGGTVRLAVAPADAEVKVTVEDDGIGIEPSELEHIFDRFYRATHDRPGSGLGLSITRDLVRLHGGDLLVRSEPGQGSAFSVLLPRRAAA